MGRNGLLAGAAARVARCATLVLAVLAGATCPLACAGIGGPPLMPVDGCASGPQYGDNHGFVFSGGFWGRRDDTRNLHEAFHCRQLGSGARRFGSTAGDVIGTMGHNTAGSFYMGESHLGEGTISFEMQVPTDAGIPEHPPGVPQKDYLFRPAMTCDACVAAGRWDGGANQGGAHFFKIANGFSGAGDRLLLDFGALQYGSIRVAITNRVGGRTVTPEPVRRFEVAGLQPDSWARIEVGWRMEAADSTGAWNRLALTVNGVTRTFELLDGSCGPGRMLELGNVDRRVWNRAGTGIVEERTCNNAANPEAVPDECRPGSRAAPFPDILFRNIRLYLEP